MNISLAELRLPEDLKFQIRYKMRLKTWKPQLKLKLGVNCCDTLNVDCVFGSVTCHVSSSGRLSRHRSLLVGEEPEPSSMFES